MYKSRSIPTLTGRNAEYFRELQAKMEHAEAQENRHSVGERVHAMMQKAEHPGWILMVGGHS